MLSRWKVDLQSNPELTKVKNKVSDSHDTQI